MYSFILGKTKKNISQTSERKFKLRFTMYVILWISKTSYFSHGPNHVLNIINLSTITKTITINSEFEWLLKTEENVSNIDVRWTKCPKNSCMTH